MTELFHYKESHMRAGEAGIIPDSSSTKHQGLKSTKKDACFYSNTPMCHNPNRKYSSAKSDLLHRFQKKYETSYIFVQHNKALWWEAKVSPPQTAGFSFSTAAKSPPTLTEILQSGFNGDMLGIPLAQHGERLSLSRVILNRFSGGCFYDFTERRTDSSDYWKNHQRL